VSLEKKIIILEKKGVISTVSEMFENISPSDTFPFFRNMINVSTQSKQTIIRILLSRLSRSATPFGKRCPWPNL
jgi:hypothetical protein